MNFSIFQNRSTLFEQATHFGALYLFPLGWKPQMFTLRLIAPFKFTFGRAQSAESFVPLIIEEQSWGPLEIAIYHMWIFLLEWVFTLKILPRWNEQFSMQWLFYHKSSRFTFLPLSCVNYNSTETETLWHGGIALAEPIKTSSTACFPATLWLESSIRYEEKK